MIVKEMYDLSTRTKFLSDAHFQSLLLKMSKIVAEIYFVHQTMGKKSSDLIFFQFRQLLEVLMASS